MIHHGSADLVRSGGGSVRGLEGEVALALVIDEGEALWAGGEQIASRAGIPLVVTIGLPVGHLPPRFSLAERPPI